MPIRGVNRQLARFRRNLHARRVQPCRIETRRATRAPGGTPQGTRERKTEHRPAHRQAPGKNLRAQRARLSPLPRRPGSLARPRRPSPGFESASRCRVKRPPESSRISRPSGIRAKLRASSKIPASSRIRARCARQRPSSSARARAALSRYHRSYSTTGNPRYNTSSSFFCSGLSIQRSRVCDT